MAKTSYWQKLRDPRWQKRRLEIMDRDKFACRMCGNDRETLNVHHLAYERNGEPWDTDEYLLVTLCEPCHEEFHDANPGANWIATLIQAGASWDDIHVIREYFGYIADGPSPRQYTRKEWSAIHEGVFELLGAVQYGASGEELRNALVAVGQAARARQEQE
jgi:hypothetical protein